MTDQSTANPSDTGAVLLALTTQPMATDSFRRILDPNADQLAQQGLDVFVPKRTEDTSGNLALCLPAARDLRAGYAPKPFIQCSRDTLKAGGWDASLPRTSVMADDTLLGDMLAFEQGRFFPLARPRLRVLAKSLGRPVDRAVLVMQDYADLYVATYASLAERGPMRDFRSFLPALVNVGAGWTGLVGEVIKGLNPCRLVLLTEPLRGGNTQALSALADRPLTDIAAPDWHFDEPVSRDAIEMMQKNFRAGVGLSQADILDIKQDFSVTKGYDRFDPLTTAERRMFSNRYRNELEAMQPAAQLDLIEPVLMAAE